MKYLSDYFRSIPNKIKALYLIWIFFHFILFLLSGNAIIKYRMDFFPFSYSGKKYFFDINSYDYSEFIIYNISPIIIYSVIYLWRKK